MELGNLSSNWKALQGKLQAQEPADGASKKRKRRPEDAAPSGRHTTAKKSPTQPSSLKNHESKRRRVMSAVSNVQRARSQSAPQRPDGDAARQHAALKPSASHADLRHAAEAERVNEGSSRTHVAGKYIAIDCEMVGVGPAPHATSQLARVSLVNVHGEQVYDSFVSPQLPVTDYRTHVSGITPALLAQGRPFEEVQQDVATLLKGRILVGHAVKNDLAVLRQSHPKSAIRDTSHHKQWKEQYCNGGVPSLRVLVQAMLGWDTFQEGRHSSVEDARAAMMLFKREKDAFEADARRRFGRAAAGGGRASLVPEDPAAAPTEEAADGTASTRKKKKKKKKKGKS